MLETITIWVCIRLHMHEWCSRVKKLLSPTDRSFHPTSPLDDTKKYKNVLFIVFNVDYDANKKFSFELSEVIWRSLCHSPFKSGVPYFCSFMTKRKGKKKVEFNASLLSDFGSKQGRSSWSKHKKQEGKCSNFFILYHLPFVSFFKRGEFVDTLYLVRYLFYA